MTKEDLENRFIKLFDLTEGFTANHFKWIINELFQQNVVIPKGENRHPYADVLHEYIEDTTKDIQYFYDNNWHSTSLSVDKYRINMATTTYEWQWIFKEHGYYKTTHCYYIDTPKSSAIQTDWKRIEESKRERK